MKWIGEGEGEGKRGRSESRQRVKSKPGSQTINMFWGYLLLYFPDLGFRNFL